MKRLFASLAGIVAIASLATTSVSAASDIDSVDGNDMSALLASAGIPGAQVSTDPYDDPYVVASFEGATFEVIFYECSDTPNETCKSVNFKGSWQNDGSESLDTMNAFNTGNRFGQAYIEAGTGNAAVEMSMTFEGGISPAAAGAYINWWKRTLTAFRSHTGF